MGLFSLGGSRQRSSSSSSSAANSRTDQSVFLADLFSSLYSGAAAAAGGVDTAQLTDAANALFQTGGGFIDALENAGTPGFIADEVQAGGVAPISVGSTAAEEIALLQSDLGNLFRDELLPAVAGNANRGNVLGGDRQSVFEREAAGDVLNAFAEGSVDIRSRDLDRRLRADLANQQSALAQLGLQVDADQFNATLGTEADLASRGLGVESALGGLGALPGLAGLADLGVNADLSPYLALAQIYGGPTVLTESESNARSSSSSSSSGRSFRFGISGSA